MYHIGLYKYTYTNKQAPSSWYLNFQSSAVVSSIVCIHISVWDLTIHDFSANTLLRSGRHQKVFETVFVFMYLNICAAYLRKHVQIRIPSCNQNRHNRFQSSFLKGAATLHISLRTEQKMGKRKKDRQKDKDEDTSAKRQWQNTARFVFKNNHHRFWKICGVYSNTTDFEKPVVFGSNTTDFGQIPPIFSGWFGWRVVLKKSPGVQFLVEGVK